MKIIPYFSPIISKQKSIEVKKVSNDRSRVNNEGCAAQLTFTSLQRVRLCPTEGSYLHTFNNACVNYTSYFRSFEAIDVVKDHLLKHFPDGAIILDYACSNGEEPESIAMQIASVNQDKRYRILAYDIDPDILDMAQNHCHCISEGFEDDFLLKDDSEITSQQKHLKDLFFEHFERTDPPAIKLFKTPDNRCEEGDNYFVAKQGAFEGIIDYRGGNESGNIENIDTVIFDTDSSPAVVLFRNAFYHLSDNPSYKPLISEYYMNPYQMGSVETVIDKIYDALPENGLLVIGNSHYDHIYLAPEGAAANETILLAETSEGKKQIQYLRQRLKAFSSLLSDPEMCRLLQLNVQQKIDEIQKARIYKTSLLQNIIEKNSRFVPVHYEPIDNFPEITVPTVWKKIQTS